MFMAQIWVIGFQRIQHNHYTSESYIIYNPNLDIHVQLNYATINKSKSPIHISTHIDKIQTKSGVSLIIK